MWRPLLAECLAANARHREADRLFHRSQRTFAELAKRLDDRRAHEIAGVNLADERVLKACRAQRQAFQPKTACLSLCPSACQRLARSPDDQPTLRKVCKC